MLFPHFTNFMVISSFPLPYFSSSPYADIPTSPLLAIDTSWDDLLTSPLSDSIGTPIIDEFEWPDGLFIDNEDVLNVALTSGG